MFQTDWLKLISATNVDLNSSQEKALERLFPEHFFSTIVRLMCSLKINSLTLFVYKLREKIPTISMDSLAFSPKLTQFLPSTYLI